MTIAAIKRRVRTLEEKRAAMGVPDDIGPWLFVCGRDGVAIREAHAAHPDAPATYVPVLWTAAEPVPSPCWGDAGSLPDAILIALVGLDDADRTDAPTMTPRGRCDILSMSDDQLMAAIVTSSLTTRVLQ